ncbi:MULTISPECIES: gas vesicle protein GvpO [Halorussus]|uniref:gas vesicle protein GvpO n=1 Tax=Halorussus TaxID=1070314 RepID=UPI0026E557E1|nr:gas vesicle protein GvpO [Halorussus vallis]
MAKSESGERDDLQDVGGVGPERADALREAGFESVDDLRDADVEALTAADGIGEAAASEILAGFGDESDAADENDGDGDDESEVEADEDEMDDETDGRETDDEGDESADANGAGEDDGDVSADGGAAVSESADLDILSARETAEEVAQTLIDEPFDGIIEVEQGSDGWFAVVEVVERSAVPDTQDILGRYEIDLDESGSVTAYRLVDRYRRGDMSG